MFPILTKLAFFLFAAAGILASARLASGPDPDACQLYVQYSDVGVGFDCSCDGICPPVGGQAVQCLAKTTMVEAGVMTSCLCNGIESSGWCKGRAVFPAVPPLLPYIECVNAACQNCVVVETGWGDIVAACACPL